MKKLILFIGCFSILHFAKAQEQAAVFNHYIISPILITPAVAGFSETHQIQVNIHSQFTGFSGAPKTYEVSYNGPIGKTLGIGLGVLSEDIGNTSRLRFQLNYAFRYQFNNVKIGAGFSTEFHTFKVDNSVRQNPFYQPGDLILDEAIGGNKIFDAALGFWATFNDQTFVGLSFQNLIVAKIGEIESGDPQGSFFKYVIFNLGHEFEVQQFSFKLEPSLMLRRIRNTPFQADFNVKASFLDEKLITAVTYHVVNDGAVGLLLGTKIQTFRIYYSYDVSFGDFQQYNSGSHEVTVVFDFAKGKKKNKHD